MSNNNTLSVATATFVALLNLVVTMPVNAQGKPALTRDVDRSSAQPVSTYCRTQTNVMCILYKVPVGKRLVVETVSYDVTSFSPGVVRKIVFGQDVANLYLAPGIGPNVYAVAPVLGYTTVYGGVESRVYSATQPLRAYFDENQVFGSVAYVSDGISADQTFTFSGYLVDK
jgi:hypothetical protein